MLQLFRNLSKKSPFILIILAVCLLASCNQNNKFNSIESIANFIQEYKEAQDNKLSDKEAQFNKLSDEEKLDEIIHTIDKALANHTSKKLQVDPQLILSEGEEKQLREICLNYLKQEQYTLLDQKLTELYESKSLTYGGYFTYRFIMDALAEKHELIDQWYKQFATIHSCLALTKVQQNRAWDARGNNWANKVNQEGWLGFREHLQLADKYTEQAKKLDPYNSYGLTNEISTGLGLGLTNERLSEIVKIGRTHNPLDGSVLSRAAYYLAPRWHGSRFQYLNLIAAEASKWPNTAGKYYALVSTFTFSANSNVYKRDRTMKYLKNIDNIYRSHFKDCRYISYQIIDNMSDDHSELALEYAKEQLKIQPNDSNLLLGKAFALFEMRKYAEVLKVYATIPLIDINYDHLRRWAYSYYVTHQYEEAIEIFKRIDNESSLVYYSLHLGESYYHSRQYAKAIPYFERLKTSISINSLNSLARCYDQADLQDQGIQFFRKLIQKNDKPQVIYNFAYLLSKSNLYETEKLEEAMQYFKQSINLNYETRFCHSSLGFILMRLKKYEEAKYYYTQEIELANALGQQPLSYSNRGKINYLLHLYDEARADFEKYIELHPHNEYYINKICPNWRTIKTKPQQKNEALTEVLPTAKSA